MKATGEVMAIGRTFEEAIQKAIRSLDMGHDGFEYVEYTEDDLVIRLMSDYSSYIQPLKTEWFE